MNKWNEPHRISHTNAEKENETKNEPYIEGTILETTYLTSHPSLVPNPSFFKKLIGESIRK